MRALPHFHQQVADYPLVLPRRERSRSAFQPPCQLRVRELDPRPGLAAIGDIHPSQDRPAQRAHLLAVRQRELDHDPVRAHQPRCRFTEKEERPSLDHVQVVLQVREVREAHLEQGGGLAFHAGRVRPRLGTSRFRPGASAYMR